MKNTRTFLIWDSPVPPTPSSDVVFDWSSQLPASTNVISIAREIDENWKNLRKEYLAWVYQIGQRNIGKKDLRSFLRYRNSDLSHWSLSLINEKSPLKSPTLYTVLKLRALEQTFEKANCARVEYHGANPLLHEIFSQWCSRTGVPYSWQNSGSKTSASVPKPRVRLRSFVFRALPHSIRAIAFLLRKCFFRAYPAFQHSRPSRAKDGITIVSYFPNLDLNAFRKGLFRSRYWEDLHQVIEKLPYAVNWVWIYSDSNQCSFKEAVRFRDQLNLQNADSVRFHLFEEFLTPKALLQSLGGWLVNYLKCFFISARLRDQFHFEGSQMNFFPILKQELESSLLGWVSMENQLWVNGFERMAQNLPARPWGLYLWEGQAWERALISAWRKNRAGKIMGYQHSSLRAMDLRFYADPRTYHEENTTLDPYPDFLVVNGSGAREFLTEAGYPEERLTLAEATRYNALAGLKGKFGKPVPSNGRTLLVLTDFLPDVTESQLALLASAEEKNALSLYDRILVKPHPYLPVNEFLTRFRSKLEVTNRPLIELWPEVDAVYCSNSTSALLEAAWVGLPVVGAAAKDSLNQSPLYGRNQSVFVSTTDELLAWLQQPQAISLPEDYFCLDHSLQRWKKLLAP